MWTKNLNTAFFLAFMSFICLFSLPLLSFSQSRESELNKAYTDLSETVKSGDDKAYQSLYHPSAVVVFGENSSISISDAMKRWSQNFKDAKKGVYKANVEFRCSSRIGNENTAFEKGIFHYTEKRPDGTFKSDSYAYFEILWVKEKGKWMILMENQTGESTAEEWNKLTEL